MLILTDVFVCLYTRLKNRKSYAHPASKITTVEAAFSRPICCDQRIMISFSSMRSVIWITFIMLSIYSKIQYLYFKLNLTKKCLGHIFPENEKKRKINEKLLNYFAYFSTIRTFCVFITIDHIATPNSKFKNNSLITVMWTF